MSTILSSDRTHQSDAAGTMGKVINKDGNRNDDGGREDRRQKKEERRRQKKEARRAAREKEEREALEAYNASWREKVMMQKKRKMSD